MPNVSHYTLWNYWLTIAIKCFLSLFAGPETLQVKVKVWMIKNTSVLCHFCCSHSWYSLWFSPTNSHWIIVAESRSLPPHLDLAAFEMEDTEKIIQQLLSYLFMAFVSLSVFHVLVHLCGSRLHPDAGQFHRRKTVTPVHFPPIVRVSSHLSFDGRRVRRD